MSAIIRDDHEAEHERPAARQFLVFASPRQHLHYLPRAHIHVSLAAMHLQYDLSAKMRSIIERLALDHVTIH